MPLINLKTDLKSLKFGKDRPGGGSSNQPYIQKDIPEGDPSNIFNTGGPDILLRGGVLAPIRAANDASRLTQMFFDLKSPTGLLFTAKQNLLSRTSVETESTQGIGYGGGTVNQGIYSPTSTIAQALAGFTGTHLNLLGLDPSSPMNGVTSGGLFPTAGLNRYEDVIKAKNNPATFSSKVLKVSEKIKNPDYIPPKLLLGSEQSDSSSPILPEFIDVIKDKIVPNDQSEFDNRLVNLWRDKQFVKNEDSILLEYPGGPGSILGIGKTRIPFSSQRTGKNNPLTVRDPQFFYSGGFKISEPIDYNNLLGASRFEKLNNIQIGIDETGQSPSKFGLIGNNFTLSKNNILGEGLRNYQSVRAETLTKRKPQQDFRISNLPSSSFSTIASSAPSYNPTDNKTIENRVGLGDPGKAINVFDYSVGSESLDKINASGLYQGSYPSHTGEGKNDLVKFSIGVLNNDSTQTVVAMNFRAFIDSFDDSYSADWGSTQYVGRGDKFYNYKGFSRNINMSWTVYAQSKAELIPMYKKLNYLASSLAPDYSEGGYMRGNLIYLTMGGYLYRQLGILNSITYTIPQESTWEIGIDTKGNSDSTVKELPHMIKVSGVSFTPIQEFVPRKANYLNQNGTRYIALDAGNGTNY